MKLDVNLFLILAMPVFATTYYLDNSATGADDGGVGNDAFQTLASCQTVLDGLGDNGSGDIVIVSEGDSTTYGNFAELSKTRTDWLIYQAATGESPELTKIFIDNQGQVYDVYLSFDGFTISPTGWRSAAEFRNSVHIKLLNCDMVSPGPTTTTYGVYCWQNTTDVTIDGCTFSGGANTGRFEGFMVGIVFGLTSGSITNNEIKQITTTAIDTYCSETTISDNNIHLIGGDGIIVNTGSGPLVIEDNEIHDLYLYEPTLSETPTATTWSADGKTMTNDGSGVGDAATWGVGEPLDWVTTNQKVEIWVNSGTNVETGDNNVTVATITSPTEMVLSKSVGDGGGTPSNVDYTIISIIHGDLIQFLSTTISNATIRRNKLYDCYGQITWINPAGAGMEGSNVVFENNLCWNTYTAGTGDGSEYDGNVQISNIDGLTVRNNIVIGRLTLSASDNINFHSNIVGYISITDSAAFIGQGYNILNHGVIDAPNAAAGTSTYNYPGQNYDKWDDALFTDMFTTYPTDLTHAAADSLGVGHGDPANSTTTDILGVTRGSPPDAGAYEFVIPDPDSPTPNPSVFLIEPMQDSSTSITMTAVTASSEMPPIEYFFDQTENSTGGSDSDWQTSTKYTDFGLSLNLQYTYRIRSRDALGNTSGWSDGKSVTITEPPGNDLSWRKDALRWRFTEQGLRGRTRF